MALKTMYITRDPAVARIAEEAGVDRVWVDLEYIGKAARQGGMDTVQSHHTIEDIRVVRGAIRRAELLVRVNPIHGATKAHGDSRSEIEAALAAGADRLMLPYFKTAAEVGTFLQIINGRARNVLLLETPEAVEALDEILRLPGIDEIHIGLNDLSLGYGLPFMFQLLADGTVERLCLKLREAGVPYGFGGIASPGKGLLPAERIIREHYRLGSTRVILSRSFCNTEQIRDLDEIRRVFETGMREIRALERECEEHASYFWDNRRETEAAIRQITETLSGEGKR